MAREYSRAERVAEQIQRELAVLVQQEVKDPRVGMVTVSAVRLSSDLSHARVYVTMLAGDSADESVRALNHAAPFLRRELGRRMVLRTLPQLQFLHDEVIEAGSRLVALIDASVARDKKKGGKES